MREIDRILSVPREEPDVSVPSWVRHFLRKPGSPHEPWDIQCRLVWETWKANGLFASAGVGWGKTLPSLSLPLAFPHVKRALLLVPPDLVEKTEREREEYREHFRISEAITVGSYGKLSVRTGEAWIRDLAPQMIICDEAHYLGNTGSARTQRVGRYLKDNQDTIFCAMTGTISRSSVRDYAHLVAWALRENSPMPLPNKWPDLESWRLCIDPDAFMEWPTRSDWRKLQKLVDAFGDGFPLMSQSVSDRRKSVRRAHLERFRTCPGIVMTSKASSDVPVVCERLEPTIPTKIEDALSDLEKFWETPGGEELCTGVEMASARKQLSLGFYYYWDWPDGIPDQQWLDARAWWHREIRKICRSQKRGLDTPGLVKRDVRRSWSFALLFVLVAQGNLDPVVLRAFMRGPGRLWKNGDLLAAAKNWAPEETKPQPPTETAWLTDKSLEQAIRIAKGRPSPCIIWYSHDAVATRLAELGVEVIPSGEEPPTEPVRTLALSTNSHVAGHQLQGWCQNLVLTPPSSALTMEQMLGRTVRPGQKADEVWVGFLCVNAQADKALGLALRRSVAQAEGEGATRIILGAEWRGDVKKFQSKGLQLNVDKP